MKYNRLFLLGMALLAAASQCHAAKKPVTKPAIKGADPMAGQNAQIGLTYTFGKPTPLNFTLTGAQYAVDRVNIEDETHTPNASEKLLVLNYSVHNPNKTEFAYDWGTIGFTAVEAHGDNHEYVGQIGDPATKKRLYITLNPAQKTAAYTAIKVPAAGPMPKLIVKYGEAVLRYDLRGKVKALSAPFADPADKTGVTALPEVAAEIGKAYPVLGWDVRLTKIEYAAGPLGDAEVEEGKRFLIATIALKNGGGANAAYDSGVFTAEVLGSDEEKVPFNGRLFKTVRNEDAVGEVKPGGEYTARFLFVVPKDVTGKKLYFSQGESRVFVFELGQTK